MVEHPGFNLARQISRSRVTADLTPQHKQEDLWQTITITKTNRAFEVTSKRRKGFPSESRVKKGVRVVHGDKQLMEKLGRNDPCFCKSGRKFQELLHAERTLGWIGAETLL